jgi:hypothetical protein
VNGVSVTARLAVIDEEPSQADGIGGVPHRVDLFFSSLLDLASIFELPVALVLSSAIHGGRNMTQSR